MADFGLAKLSDESDLTLTGDLFGTPPYMSPEQAQDSGNVTIASDIYSLGATLYHVLTGEPPFRGDNALITLKRILDEDVVPPSTKNPAVDRDLEIICLKCLEKEPGKRYRTAEEVEEELARYLNREPIHARRAGVMRKNMALVPPKTLGDFGCVVGVLGRLVIRGRLVVLAAVEYGTATQPGVSTHGRYRKVLLPGEPIQRIEDHQKTRLAVDGRGEFGSSGAVGHPRPRPRETPHNVRFGQITV